jgi:F-type H+-transporting ATPase subunit a
MLTMFAVMAIILIVFTLVARRATMVPTHGQSIVELILEFIMDLVEATAGKKLGRRLLPLISGMFIFIFFANLTGLLPGMGTIGKWEEEPVDSTTADTVAVDAPATSDTASTIADEAVNGDHEAAGESEHEKVLVPFIRAPNADLNMTLAMSLLTFFLVQVAGVSAHGVIGRIKHLGDPWFIFPIEVVSEFARIISLSARLFGNVFAGEVLLGVMYTMGAAIKIAVVPFLFPVVFMGLEVLFGTIQALVFALLTLIYITLAVASHDDHDEAHEGGHDRQLAHAGASGD